MSDHISIGISEFAIAEAPAFLVTYGLGSCVAIALYDPERRIGAMAHTLLPSPPSERSPDSKSPKYTSSAVELMVEELGKRGCAAGRVVAKLAGGACMFNTLCKSFRGVIGDRNVAEAKAALEKYGIPLLSEDTGGDYGRTIEFCTATGNMLVKALQRPNKTI